MNKLFETDRLFLREWILEDAQNFFDLNNDPEVIRYTGDPPFESLEATEEFMLSKMKEWADGCAF